jgi:hypothetical protein
LLDNTASVVTKIFVLLQDNPGPKFTLNLQLLKLELTKILDSPIVNELKVALNVSTAVSTTR